MTENKFSDILKNLRRINKHTQEDLANLLQVRKTTISNYETGYSTPDSKTLIKISQIYNVSVSNLLGQTFIGVKQPTLCEENTISENQAVKKILVINDLTRIENKNDGEILYCVSIPIKNIEDGEYIGVKIQGDFLNKARLNDGDVAIIRLQKTVENGDIAVLCVNEKDYFMVKFYNNNTFIMLAPDSFNENHSPIVINATSDRYKIIGKVVHAIINL